MCIRDSGNVAPEHKLRVVAPDVGGGFGSKINVYNEDIVCSWAAKKINRAIKWVAERSESFLTDNSWQRSRYTCRVSSN